MAMSIDVNLPRKHPASFPKRCVVCGIDHPDSTVTLVTGSLGWWTWLLGWFARPFKVTAPACHSCSWRLHAARLLSLLVTVALVLAAFYFVWPYFADAVPRRLRKWAMIGLALVCLSPQCIYEVLYPKPFDITAFADSVDYEFANEDLAVEFAALNCDAEWVKVEGQQLLADDQDMENEEKPT